jgi:hypothetical protein
MNRLGEDAKTPEDIDWRNTALKVSEALYDLTVKARNMKQAIERSKQMADIALLSTEKIVDGQTH